MIVVSYYDSDGFFTGTEWLADLADATPPAGGGYVLGEYDSAEDYVVGGVADARPVIVPVDEIFHILADGIDSVLIEDLPAGTSVVDHLGNTTELTAIEDLTIRSILKGEFSFSLVPPFPYRETNFTVIAYAD